MVKIQTLNNISPIGLDKLPREGYEVASEVTNPDAIWCVVPKCTIWTLAII